MNARRQSHVSGYARAARLFAAVIALTLLAAPIPAAVGAEGCHLTRAQWEQDLDRARKLLHHNQGEFQTTVAGLSRGITYSGYAGLAPEPGPGWAEKVLEQEFHAESYKSNPEHVGAAPGLPSRASILIELAELSAYYNRCLRDEKDTGDVAEPADDLTGGAWAEFTIPISTDGGDTEHVAWTCDGSTWQVRHETDMLEGAYGTARFTMPPRPAEGPWKSAPFPYEYGFKGEVSLGNETNVFEWHFTIASAVAEVVDVGSGQTLLVHYSYEWTHVAWDGSREMPGHSGIAGPEPLWLGSYEECP